jgi:hypothetical protein
MKANGIANENDFLHRVGGKASGIG